MGDSWQDMVRQMGKDGWLGIGWPKEYGGQGRGPVEQLIFFEEAGRAGAPIPLVTLNTVGPTLAQYGTDEQKERFLPKILAGEIHFAIGYTEPEAGTDLASLRTTRRARRRRVRRQRPEGLHDRRPRRRLRLARVPHRPGRAEAPGHLDPDRRHERPGLLVDADPHRRRRPHQRDVLRGRARARRTVLVGEENGGWKMITTQLNFERVALGPAGRIFRSLDAVTALGQGDEGARRPAHDRPGVGAHQPGARPGQGRGVQLFNWRIAALQEHGELNPGTRRP